MVAVETGAAEIGETDEGEVVAAAQRQREPAHDIEGVGGVEPVIAVGGVEVDRPDRAVRLVDDEAPAAHQQQARLDDPELAAALEIDIAVIEAGPGDEVIRVTEQRRVARELQRPAEAVGDGRGAVDLAGVRAIEEIGDGRSVPREQHRRPIAEAQRARCDQRVASLRVRRVAVGDLLAEMAVVEIAVDGDGIAGLVGARRGQEGKIVPCRLRGGEDRATARRQQFDRRRADGVDEIGGAGERDIEAEALAAGAQIAVELVQRGR